MQVNIKRHKFDSWVGKIRWRRAWQPTNPMGRGAWRAIVHRAAESWTLKRLSTAQKQCVRVSAAHPLLVGSAFWVSAVLLGAWWYLMVLI